MNETKKYILEKSLQLFLSKSYKEVTMNDIIEATQLSKGGFYHYFKSKEDAFTQAVSFFIQSFNGSFTPATNQSFKEFYTSILEITKNAIKQLNKNKEFDNGNYFNLLFDAMRHFEGLKEKSVKKNKAERKLWITVIENAQKKGEIKKNLDPAYVSDLFILTFDGLYIRKMKQGNAKNFFQELTSLWNTIYIQISVS